MSTYQTPDVSVVIPAYNSQRSIKRALDSVFSQDNDLLKEIIVVNDGSTDNTAEVVGSYDSPLITYIEQENQGPAVARNKGIALATGKYISFLDADDYWKPGFLYETVKFLENNQDAIAVNTGYVKEDWKGRTFIKPVLTDNDKLYFYSNSGSLCENFFEFWAKYRSVLTGTVLMRTDYVRKTGGQRTELRLTQDLEFWGYLATFGKWGFIPKPLFVTDERILTRSQRLEKMRRRFNFFAGINLEDWSKRISNNISDDRSKKSFELIKKHIYTTIVFANVYSRNYTKSFSQIKMYPSYIQENGWGLMLRTGHRFGRIFWPISCELIILREMAKTYLYPYIVKFKSNY